MGVGVGGGNPYPMDDLYGQSMDGVLLVVLEQAENGVHGRVATHQNNDQDVGPSPLNFGSRSFSSYCSITP
jgi:hypothetical protein